MKQLTRKLFLSICTLAICAVTLVSTTFAWWTTNTDVEANGITGTASSSGDASIFISTNHIDWTQSVTLSTANQTLSANPLTPVQLTTNGTFHSLEGSVSNGVLTFTLYFKTTNTDEQNVMLYISNLVIKNSLYDANAANAAKAEGDTSKVDTVLTKFDNLLYGSTSTNDLTGVNRNQSKYAVDIIKSLGMYTNATNPNNADYNVKNFFDLKTIANSYAIPNFNVSDLDALAAADEDTVYGAEPYYNEVMKNEDATTSLTLADLVDLNTNMGSRVALAQLPSNGDYIQIDFTVFINGWDEYCFDACKTQTFNIELDFSTVQTQTTTE